MATNDNGTTAAPAGQSLMSLIQEAGFTGQAAQTMYAIVMAESGANATSLNNNASTGDDSYGLAQINMIGQLGPERLKEYGLKSANDLFDPLTNLRVAYALSNGGTNFSPWTTFTRGTYEKFMGQSGATVKDAGPGMTAAISGASGDAADPTGTDYQSALGQWAPLLTEVPELKGLLQQAIQGSWSTAHFEQQVQQSQWWRTHSDEAKTLIGMQSTDPGEYSAQVNSSKLTVEQAAKTLGVTLSAAQIQSLGLDSLMSGWNSDELNSQIASYLNGSSPLAGTYANNYQQLQQIYSDYGLPVNDATLRSRAQQVTENAAALDTYKTQAINSAKGLYPALGEQLDSGLTVKDIADPYIQTEANLLEINPDNVGLTDPLVKKALQGTVTTTGGKSSATSTPLYQFEQQVRSDPRWQFTQNATDTISSALLKVGSDFGFGPEG